MSGLTDLLLKRFAGDKAAHAAVGKLAGAVGIICNLFLSALKLVAGVLSGSVAVVADALNNVSDAAASVVALFGFRLAERPADSDHPYGHGRYEYIAGTVIAALILLMGCELARSSVMRIFSPVPVEVTALTIAALVVSLIVKLWLSVFYGKLGRKISSGTLFAAAADSRNDVLATSAVLVSCLCGLFFDIDPDAYIGLAVSIFIIYSGITTAKDAVSPLLGKRADPALVDGLCALILSHDKELGIHDLLVHDYGPGSVYASVHVELDADDDVIACHELIDEIEDEAFEKKNVRLVIHYDPVVRNDAEQNEAAAVVGEAVSALDPRFSVHDLRIVRRSTRKKLVFDISLPYSSMKEHEKIKSAIDEALASRGLDYFTVIRFDGK